LIEIKELDYTSLEDAKSTEKAEDTMTEVGKSQIGSENNQNKE
jgi:hypothetical protein